MDINYKLNILKLSLNASKLDLKNIQKQINEILKYKELRNYDYLNTLLYPEKSRGCKIPTQMPLWSTTFNFKRTYTFTTNNNGGYLGFFNPFFLMTDCANPIYYKFHDEVTDTDQAIWCLIMGTCVQIPWNLIDGTTIMPNNAQTPSIYVGQNIPNIYSSFRLVSGSLNLRYIDSYSDTAGYMFGAIINSPISQVCGRFFEATVSDSPPPAPDPDTLIKWNTVNIYKWGNPNNVRQLPYYREKSCLEGIRLLYYPSDNSYEEFMPILTPKDFKIRRYKGLMPDNFYYPSIIPNNINLFKDSFEWVFGVYNSEPHTTFYVDINLNFECLVNSEYNDIIPSTKDNLLCSLEDHKNALLKIKNQAVQ